MLPPRPLFSPRKIQGRISSSWGDAGSYEFCCVAGIPDGALGQLTKWGSFALLRMTDLIWTGYSFFFTAEVFILYFAKSTKFRIGHPVIAP